MSEKEEKDVDEVAEVEEEEGERWRESSVTDISALPPVRRRQKKREELPVGWERHEVSGEIEIFSRSERSHKY